MDIDTMFCKDKARYDLSLEKSCFFIPKAQTTEPPTSVDGQFCILLRQTAYIKSIKVRLRGVLTIPRDGFLVTERCERRTFELEQPIASSRSRRSFPMAAGNYKFPFSIPLPEDISDSAFGPNKYHSYHVDAVIKRPYIRDIVVSQPLQIYKFISELEIPDTAPYVSQTEEDCPAHGIQHRISIPSPNIPFGCVFPVDISLWTPEKDITLDTITIQVIEKHKLHVDATAAQSARYNIYSIRSARSHTLVSKTFEFTESDPNKEWHLTKMTRLPQELDKCSQTISTRALRIEHFLVVTAKFRDDERTIESTETIPFHIYMTPSVIGSDALVRGKVLQDRSNPPPSYGEHTSCPRLREPDFESVLGNQTHVLRVLEGGLCREDFADVEPPVYASLGVVSS